MVHTDRHDHILGQRNESKRGRYPRQYRHVSFVYILLCDDYLIFVAEPAVCFTDTGIQVTNDVARQIYSGIQGAQAISDTEWSIPCELMFTISLSFGGKLFTITERDTILRQSSGSCTGVVTGGATQGIGQVGAPFLRNFYTFVPVFPIMPASDALFFLPDNSLQPSLRMGWFNSASGSRRKFCARILPQLESFLKQLLGHLQPPRVRRITVVPKLSLTTLCQHWG